MTTNRKPRFESGLSRTGERTPTATATNSAGPLIADPVTMLLGVVKSALDFGTAYIALQAEKEKTQQLEIQVMAEHQRHAHRLKELQAEFITLQTALNAQEEQRRAVMGQVDFLRHEVERCRTQLDQALGTPSLNLPLLKLLQENYLRLVSDYSQLSARLVGG